MEVRIADCPLGAKCEEVREVEGKPVVFRCPLYQSLKVQTEPGEWIDEWKCSAVWTPILLIENRNAMDACAKYTESLRNELIARLDRARRLRDPEALKVIVEQPSGES